MRTVVGGSPPSGELLPSLSPVLETGEPVPWPTEFKDFDTHNVGFWELEPLPVGSVLTFTVDSDLDPANSEAGVIAVLVLSSERDESGIWITCRFLGSDKDWGRKWGVKTFSRSKKCVHLCREIEDCIEEPGHHVVEFGFWPVGTFRAGYVEKRQRKYMDDFVAALKRGEDPLEEEKQNKDKEKETSASRKLAELRKKLVAAKGSERDGKGKSVSFAQLPAKAPRAGILKRRPHRSPSPPVKEELRDSVLVSSESERSRKRSRGSSSKKTVGSALYAAIENQQQLKVKDRAPMGVLALTEGEAHGSRARKRKKKKKERKKKKKKDSSSDGSTSSCSSSSSSSALKPPLQRKAEKKPGSVLKMLMDHVRLSLSDMSLADPLDGGAAAAVSSAAKVTSYFDITSQTVPETRRSCMLLLFHWTLWDPGTSRRWRTC